MILLSRFVITPVLVSRWIQSFLLSDASTNGSGYFIAKSTNGRITVCAPGAEQSATITVTR